VALSQGDYAAARGLIGESLALNRELGLKGDIASTLVGLARVSSAEGQPERAARLLGAAATLPDAIDVLPPPNERPDYEHTVATTRAQLDEQVWAAAWAEGKALSLEQAIAYALEAPAPSGA
jgi:hypothetical protein